jgi:hypothetical protein
MDYRTATNIRIDGEANHLDIARARLLEHHIPQKYDTTEASTEFEEQDILNTCRAQPAPRFMPYQSFPFQHCDSAIQIMVGNVESGISSRFKEIVALRHKHATIAATPDCSQYKFQYLSIRESQNHCLTSLDGRGSGHVFYRKPFS